MCLSKIFDTKDERLGVDETMEAKRQINSAYLRGKCGLLGQPLEKNGAS